MAAMVSLLQALDVRDERVELLVLHPREGRHRDVAVAHDDLCLRAQDRLTDVVLVGRHHRARRHLLAAALHEEADEARALRLRSADLARAARSVARRAAVLLEEARAPLRGLAEVRRIARLRHALAERLDELLVLLAR